MNPKAKAKQLYEYHIDTNDVKEMREVGEYGMSHRRPLEIDDFVLLEVYPPIPEENPTVEQMMWSQVNPPEYYVLGKVSRFTKDKTGVFFTIVEDKSCNNCGHREPDKIFITKTTCVHCFQYEFWIPIMTG